MYRIANGVRSAHGPEYGIVLDLRRGELFQLNTVGGRIFELLRAGAGEREIVDTIGLEFGIGFATAERDVREFITTLRQHGLAVDGID